ncbi:MAG: aminotransferase class IV [Fimbriimonadaceae bacterium]|nr:aminotransferase class IV [Chitinophagales bacterium]
MQIYYNANYINSDELKISSSSRAFKYGDGLFESLLVINQNPVFLEYNLKRLFKGMQLLEIEIPEDWDNDFLKASITKLSKKNRYKNARCKITVWRGGEGLYKPEKNQPELLIELTEHENKYFELNEDGIVAGLFDKMQKQLTPLSACKTLNAIPYVMAAKYAHEQNLNDVVLLNTDGKIADAISSNIFLVLNNAVFTTEENNGGVEGTMQQVIYEHAEEWNLKLERIEITKKELLMADEFFLTNAIQGIKWVKQFEEKRYTNEFAKKLTELLNSFIKKAFL